MTSTNIKDISIICEPSNKNSDNSYKINLGTLSNFSFIVCSIKSVSFRNLQYNVIGENNPRQNNKFYFTLAATEYEIIVTPGFYTVYELLDFLTPRIEAILAGSAIIPLPTLTKFEYSSITGKVSIIVNGNGSATNFELTGGLNFQSVNALLGNTTDLTLDTLGAVDTPFNDFVNLQHDDRVFLVSSAIASSGGVTNINISDQSNGRNVNLLRTLTVSEGFGELVTYESNDIDAEALHYTLPQNFTVIDIALTDVYGNILDLGNSTMGIDILVWKQAV